MFRAHTAARPAAVRRRPPRWLFGIATVAAAATIAFVLALQGGSTTPPSATAALLQAAKAAFAHALPFPSDEQFYYVRSQTSAGQPIRRRPLRLGSPTAPPAIVAIEEQLWFSANRTGRVSFRAVSVRFPSAAARARWVRLGRPSFAPPPAGISAGTGRYLIGTSH